jgi:photosystem II stability/assembly factor-like uncharacterized protein
MQPKRFPSFALLNILITAACGWAITPGLAQPVDADLFQALRFRFIGPHGNRAIAVAGVPGNPQVSYIGAASGGLWKTDDMGFHWRPVFDGQDDSSVGAVALAPANPNQVWVGTGETFLIRPHHAVGNGVYKSSNAGRTWKHLGLEKTFRISRVLVHPTDTNTVYVASMGHTHAPQQERGVYKTTDGGKTWQRILFVNELTGCSDLAMDSRNPNVLYAAMWQVEITTWNLKSGGPGSGIYRSRDGGATWEPLRNGLESGPAHPVGKTSVDVSYTNPNIVYALVEDNEPRLYRSADGGDSWQLMQKNHSMGQRAGYYTRVRVSTRHEDEVYTICVTVLKSVDGGKSFVKDFSPYAAGGDNHDMWFDPNIPDRIMCAHDAGTNLSFNGGKTWKSINLPIAQMYHVAVDNQVPYFVYSNRQDAWSYRGPSRNLGGWNIPLGLWTGVGGCESGFAQPDPFDPNTVWSGCYDGGLDVFDVATQHARDVRVWPETQIGQAPALARYRWHWNFPLVLSRHTRGRVWVGSQVVHQSDNRGQSWQPISDDLTTNDKSHQQNSGGMASDNLMTWDGCTLLTLAESPAQANVLWAGSNDGLIHITLNGGQSWQRVSDNLPGQPKWATIRHIEASWHAAGTAYVAAQAQYIGDFNPYVYKTTNFGATWKRLSIPLPASNSNYVHQIVEDPGQRGLLFLGTDIGLYVSFDDGQHWTRLKSNLPPAPVYGITIQPQFRDLVVATYGRGIYILDDITPLREWSAQVQEQPAHLFGVRPTYRFRQRENIKSDDDVTPGQNPPEGAAISFYFNKKSADSISLRVLNANNEVVQQLPVKNRPGLQRVWWDLRLEDYVLPKLRTKPRGKDWVQLNENGERNMFIYDLDIGPGLTAPLVPPGTYTIVLKAHGAEFPQPVTVLRDPSTRASDNDIQLQYTHGANLHRAVNTCLSLIADMEKTRARLLLSKDKKALAQEEKIYQLEARLHDVYATGARMDIFRNPPQVLERLLAMSKEGIVSSADYPPTDQQREVFALQEKILLEVETAYKNVKISLGNKK